MSVIRRVVLTGGPRAGKSSVFSVLEQRLGATLGFGPEVATRLLAEGHPVPSSEDEVRAFQQRVIEEQRRIEEALEESHPGRAHILDRGLPDGASYWPGGPEAFADHFDLHWETELRRYELVIHLESHVPEEAVVRDGNATRFETHEQALALDMRIRQIWEAHPGYLHLKARPRIEDKLTEALDHLGNHGVL
jgi:predicted ATPase